MTHNRSLWRSVTLYGVDHSPWVQGVLLALNYHRISSSLTSRPLSLQWYWQYGLIFPALQLLDGSRYTDSFKIYELMDRDGFRLGIDKFTPQERLSAQSELELLFSIYALGRCMPGKRWRFIKAWSTMSDRPSTIQGSICRAFLSIYFWILIQIGIYFARRRFKTPYHLKKIEALITVWDERLADRTWLTGDEIGFLDFALWGHLQCMTSGLTDELLSIVQKQDHLMSWIQRLHELDIDGVSPYTSRLLVDDDLKVTQDIGRRNRVFWITWFIALCLLPLTLLFVMASLLIRSKNPSRTGAMIHRVSKRNEN